MDDEAPTPAPEPAQLEPLRGPIPLAERRRLTQDPAERRDAPPILSDWASI